MTIETTGSGVEALFVVLWLGLVIVASVLFRHSRDRPLFSTTPPSATFVERWASGNSNGHLLARLGSASNCLFVAVTPREFIVRPQFPLSLMFLPEIFDLEHTIPRGKIRSVEIVYRWFGSLIEVKFIAKSGSEQSLFLYLRKREQVLSAIRDERAPL